MDQDTIEMHDLIQDMGISVVNMQRHPGRRSRLWLVEDIKEVMRKKTGTEEIEAICTPIIDITEEDMINMRSSMTKMTSLRILEITLGLMRGHQHSSIEYLSNKLCWLVWHFYRWESLPANFEPERLVHLQLPFNSMYYLWTGIKHLPYLQTLDLTLSKRLKGTPDFTGMPNLEYLHLGGCSNLEEVSPSLRCCRKLIQLDLGSCLKLESLPEEIGDLENLEKLDASNTAISQPPSSIVRLNKLKLLKFGKDKPDVSEVHFVFPPVGEGLRSLESLDLSFCNLKYGGLPEDIGCLSSLKELYLRGNHSEHLPRSIAELGALRVLDLGRCKRLKELPELPPELDELSANCVVILKDIHSLVTKNKLLNLIVNDAYVDNDSIYNSLARALHWNLSSKQQDISASDSLSQRIFSIDYSYKGWTVTIPSWFHCQGEDTSVSVDLPKNWYIHDNFLGFAVCYDGILVQTTVYMIPLCDDGDMLWMTQRPALHNYSKLYTGYTPLVHFFFVPVAGNTK